MALSFLEMAERPGPESSTSRLLCVGTSSVEFQGAPSLADGMGYTACSPQSEVTRWGEASLGPASD